MNNKFCQCWSPAHNVAMSYLEAKLPRPLEIVLGLHMYSEGIQDLTGSHFQSCLGGVLRCAEDYGVRWPPLTSEHLLGKNSHFLSLKENGSDFFFCLKQVFRGLGRPNATSLALGSLSGPDQSATPIEFRGITQIREFKHLQCSVSVRILKMKYSTVLDCTSVSTCHLLAFPTICRRKRISTCVWVRERILNRIKPPYNWSVSFCRLLLLYWASWLSWLLP